MMRHFKECIATGVRPIVGAAESQVLMQMMDAIYQSAETGRSVEIKSAGGSIGNQSMPVVDAGEEVKSEE
jgi:hypothetical protein